MLLDTPLLAAGYFILQEDKASGRLQRCTDVLCHEKHDAHLAARHRGVLESTGRRRWKKVRHFALSRD